MYFFSQPILDMFKQNTHQMKIFEISILLAFFTKNLVKLHLKFVAPCSIDQNARSSCEVTLSFIIFCLNCIQDATEVQRIYKTGLIVIDEYTNFRHKRPYSESSLTLTVNEWRFNLSFS